MQEAIKRYLESVLDENAKLRARVTALEAALVKADELVDEPECPFRRVAYREARKTTQVTKEVV